MNCLQTFYSNPVISSIRRNHGLEHATLHVFADLRVHGRIAGYSDNKGFWLIGRVPTATVENAAQIALNRMKSGETHLAVHPNCGTNFVTSGVIVGLVAWITLLGSERSFMQKLKYLPNLLINSTLALILSRPLGDWLQARVTTCGEPGDLQIIKVLPLRLGNLTIHRILTRG